MKATALFLGICCLWSAAYGQGTLRFDPSAYEVTEGDPLEVFVEVTGTITSTLSVGIEIPLPHFGGASFQLSVELSPSVLRASSTVTIPESPAFDGTLTSEITMSISAVDQADFTIEGPATLTILDATDPPATSSSVMPSPSSVVMPESSSMVMPESSSMIMTDSSSAMMPDSSSMVMPESSSMVMPESSSMIPESSSMMPESSSMMPESSSMIPESSSMMPESSSMMPESSSMMPESSSMIMPSPTMTPSPSPTPLPQVRLALADEFLSAEEGESVEVTISVDNFADEAQNISALVQIFSLSDAPISYPVQIYIAANSSAEEVVEIETPENEVLNLLPQTQGLVVLNTGDPDAYVLPPQSTAFLLMVDDDFVELGFDEHEVSFYESEGLVHICVRLLEGEGCQRPVAIRVYSRECPDASYPAYEDSDFERLLDIVTLNVDAEEDDLVCTYVQLVDDEEVERNETFKLIMETTDINAFVPFEYRTITVTILNDDVVMCPEFDVQYGYVNFTTREVGGMATTTCDEFFSLSSGDSVRTCQENGTWSGEEPTCSPDAISLSCSYELVGGSAQGPLNVSCSATGPFEITNITCNYDNGTLIEPCEADMLIDFADFDPGNHTLVVMVTDAGGQEADSDPIDFTVFRPLMLDCVQESSLPFQFAFSCSVNNELASDLTCRLFNGSSYVALSDCPLALGEIVTVGQPPLEPGVNFTIEVSGTDVFGSSDTDELEFTIEAIPNLMLQFIDDTPYVMDSQVAVNFSSNLPLDSATCALQSGSSGSCTIAADGLSGYAVLTRLTRTSPRTITITGVAFGQSYPLFRNVRSESTGQCSVHLINEGLTMTADNATLDLQLVGPSSGNRVSDVRCRIATGDNAGTFGSCDIPVVLSIGDAIDQANLILGPGAQQLCVQPVDPNGQGNGGDCSREQTTCVDISI